MAYDVTYNADFNILATITAPLFKSTDPNIKLDTNATLSLANLVASHIDRVYETVPTKVGAATVRLDRAYGSSPISTGLTLATIHPTRAMYQTAITLVRIAIANLATILLRCGIVTRLVTMKASRRLSIALIVEQELLSTNLERMTMLTNRTYIAAKLRRSAETEDEWTDETNFKSM